MTERQWPDEVREAATSAAITSVKETHDAWAGDFDIVEWAARHAADAVLAALAEHVVPRTEPEGWEWGRQLEPDRIVECVDEAKARREVAIDQAKKWYPDTVVAHRPVFYGPWEVAPDA